MPSNKVKSLADGQLSNSQTTLYVCPSGKSAIIGQFTYVNTDGSAHTVDAWLQRSGSSARKKIPSGMSLGIGSAAFITDEENKWYLAAGDTILGSADTANVIDYSIEGVERT